MVILAHGAGQVGFFPFFSSYFLISSLKFNLVPISDVGFGFSFQIECTVRTQHGCKYTYSFFVFIIHASKHNNFVKIYPFQIELFQTYLNIVPIYYLLILGYSDYIFY